MSADPKDAPRPLPDRPNLRHLKAQAKDLLKAGAAQSIADAQFRVARLYGFASWPKIKAHVESFEDIGRLKYAIDRNDFERVKTMMTRKPGLHGAPLGYGNDGPLTWVAECRVQWGWRDLVSQHRAVSPMRLAIARWMIENGSDVHQGGDGPLMRASLSGERTAMMELLVSQGANVNAEWHNEFPIIFAPCETLDPVALKWLLDHGANPNCDKPHRKYPGTALDYVIGSYVRCSPDLSACIEILLGAGAVTKYDIPCVVDLLRGRLDRLMEHLEADPSLVDKRFPELDFGATGGRLLTLRGATLLHVAVEYRNLDAATLLLNRGADVNVPAAVADTGVGGQTPIFHAVTQSGDEGLPMVRLLVEHGADLSVRVKLPGHYERPDEVVECTPLGYSIRFQDERSDKARTIAFLRERGAVE